MIVIFLSVNPGAIAARNAPGASCPENVFIVCDYRIANSAGNVKTLFLKQCHNMLSPGKKSTSWAASHRDLHGFEGIFFPTGTVSA